MLKLSIGFSGVDNLNAHMHQFLQISPRVSIPFCILMHSQQDTHTDSTLSSVYIENLRAEPSACRDNGGTSPLGAAFAQGRSQKGSPFFTLYATTRLTRGDGKRMEADEKNNWQADKGDVTSGRD